MLKIAAGLSVAVALSILFVGFYLDYVDAQAEVRRRREFWE